MNFTQLHQNVFIIFVYCYYPHSLFLGVRTLQISFFFFVNNLFSFLLKIAHQFSLK